MEILLRKTLSVLMFAGYLSILEAFCTIKYVTVIGQLGCGDRALKNVEVELREHDTFDPDDSLNTTTSDSTGHFTIFGEHCEVGNIEPYLRIIHNCEDNVLLQNCVIKDDFIIPADRIGKIYDMGIVSLNIARKNHQKKCH